MSERDTRVVQRILCTKCGWPAHGRFGSDRDCDPLAGAAVTRLALEIPDGVTCTREGYGYHRAGFEIDEDVTLVLGVSTSEHRPTMFGVEYLFGVGCGMTHDQTAELIRALAAWRRGTSVAGPSAENTARRQDPIPPAVVTRWQCITCRRRLQRERAADGTDPQVCVECRAQTLQCVASQLALKNVTPGIPLAAVHAFNRTRVKQLLASTYWRGPETEAACEQLEAAVAEIDRVSDDLARTSVDLAHVRKVVTVKDARLKELGAQLSAEQAKLVLDREDYASKDRMARDFSADLQDKQVEVERLRTELEAVRAELARAPRVIDRPGEYDPPTAEEIEDHARRRRVQRRDETERLVRAHVPVVTIHASVNGSDGMLRGTMAVAPRISGCSCGVRFDARGNGNRDDGDDQWAWHAALAIVASTPSGQEPVQELAQDRENACVIGVPCDRHAGAVHGREAEELRSGIEAILKDSEADWACVRALLDHVDARDSLAFREMTECSIEGCLHHAHPDCPCGHPPGERGPCGGCNCCDEAP